MKECWIAISRSFESSLLQNSKLCNSNTHPSFFSNNRPQPLPLPTHNRHKRIPPLPNLLTLKPNSPAFNIEIFFHKHQSRLSIQHYFSHSLPADVLICSHFFEPTSRRTHEFIFSGINDSQVLRNARCDIIIRDPLSPTTSAQYARGFKTDLSVVGSRSCNI